MGNEKILDRFIDEIKYVSGVDIVGAYASEDDVDSQYKSEKFNTLSSYLTYEEMLDSVDAVYVNSPLSMRPALLEKALLCGKHVLTEFPFCTDYEKSPSAFALIATSADAMAPSNTKLIRDIVSTPLSLCVIKAMYMSLHLGGKQSIMSSDMKMLIRTLSFSINSRVKD